MFFFFFEDDIIDLIKSSLSSDEALESVEGQRDYGYDFFLPLGCKKLGFPNRTALEIKKRLAPGTVSTSILTAIDLVAIRDIERYVVLYDEADAASLRIRIPQILYNKFDLISVAEFKLRVGDNLSLPQIKNWKIERTDRLEKIKSSLQFAPNSLFVGAGLSCSLGAPDWEALLTQLTNKMKLEPGSYEDIAEDSKKNSLLVARYLKNIAKSRKRRMVTYLRSILYKKRISATSAFLNAVIDLIKRWRFEEIITYNFDNYLESALLANGIKNNSVDCQSRRIKNYLPVLHVHGMIHPTDKTFDKNVVLAEDEYHELYRDSYHWANVAQLYALTHTTCLFVGLSMTDPSLRRLLDIANKQGSGNVEHYAFLRRDEFKNHRETEEIFSQMGVGIIWCENKEDVAVQVARLS